MHLRALPLEVVFADAPPPTEGGQPERGDALGGRACAIRESARGRSVLVAVSPAALAAGVRPGMTEAEGKAVHSATTIRDREPSLELVHLERASELLFAYGPEVEVCPPSTLFVELGRSRPALRRRFGEVSEREILERLVTDLRGVGHLATAALADDPDTARTLAEHLARQASDAARAARAPPKKRRRSAPQPSGEPPPPPPEVAVIPPGRARAELARLPLSALVWTDRASDPEGRLEQRLHAAVEALRALGLRDVGGLGRLGARELGSRFGEAGVRLAERARGACVRPLRRYVPPERIEEDFELEAATEALEPVLFVLRRLLHRLEARLSARQRAAAGLALDFLIEPGLEHAIDVDAARAASSKRREVLTVRFARPTRSVESMFAIAREKIGGALPGAVLALRVVIEAPEADRGAQLDLFSRRTQKAEALGELVGRLGAALGDTEVFSPRLADTHRPEAGWSRERFRVDAALAPPPPPARPPPTRFEPRVVKSGPSEDRALPRVDEGLSVVRPEVVPDPRAAAEVEAWPKPRPRRPEDEPPPPLPPRPLELLSIPEPASFHEGREVLGWRGRRLPLRSVSGREHLRTEWWRPDPLERDYLTVETEDGRRLWVFVTPDGAAFVHGLFD